MSYTVQEWAEDAPVRDTYERIILMKMAMHASNDGTGTWPAIATMARVALCDTKTVKRRLRQMERRGLIARGDQSRNAHLRRDRRPTVYDVQVPRSWYGDSWHKICQEAREAGRDPVNPATRPDIAPPPSTGRTQRADTGVKRPDKAARERQRRGQPTGGPESGSHGGTGSDSTGGQDSAYGANGAGSHHPENPGETPGHGSYPQTGGLTDPPDATGGLETHGGSNSPATGGLIVLHGGSNRPPNMSLRSRGHIRNKSFISSSSVSLSWLRRPVHGGTGTSDDEEETPNQSISATEQRDDAGASASQGPGNTPAGTGALLARFWQALPDEIRPNTRQQSKLGTLVAELLAVDGWGQDQHGPELLAGWFQRRVPRSGVRSLPAWFRTQIEHVPAGPSDFDRQHVIPWEHCPEGCDRAYWLEDAYGRATRCTMNHSITHKHGHDRRTGDYEDSPGDNSELGSDEIYERIRGSLGAAPGIPREERAPAGARGYDPDAPPF